MDGDLPEDAALRLTVTRVVQEALTNTLKHAGATRAAVTVRCTRRAVQVEVVDDGAGTGTPGGGSGRGLIGLRERTDRIGGTLDAGPLPGGGWRVRADLPRGVAP